MALELQLSTQRAREEIARIQASLSTLEQAFAKTAKTTNLEAALDRLSRFKGIESSAVTTLNNLSRAIDFLGKTSSTVSNVARQLNSLARVRVDAVAANVDRINKALSGLRVPPGLDRLAQVLSRVSSSAQMTATSLRNVASAANSIRVPPGLNAMTQGFGRAAAGARGTSAAFGTLGGVTRTLTGVLTGFGVFLGGFGFARFIQGTFDAVTAVDKFNNTIIATQGADKLGGAMDFVRKTAKDLKVSFEGLVQSYGKFSAASTIAGASIKDTNKIFRAVSVAARVLKLDQDRVRLSFLALEQMFSKGRIQMEELRRQLGEQIPGAFQIMARSLNVSTAELSKMIEKTGLAAEDVLPKFADELLRTFGPGLSGALESPQAAMTNFSNVVFDIKEAFGRGFFDAFTNELDSLAATLSDPSMVESARALGTTLGNAFGALIKVTETLVRNFDVMKFTVLAFAGIKLGSIVQNWVRQLAVAGAVATTTTRSVGGMVVAFRSVGLLGNVIAGFSARMAAAGLAARAFALSLGPIGIAVAALVTALPIIMALFERFTQEMNDIAVAAQNLGATIVEIADKFGVLDAVSEVFNNLGSAVATALNSISQWLSETVGISFDFSRVLDDISKALGVFGKYLSFLINPIETFINLINNLLRAVAGLSPQLKQSAQAANDLGSGLGDASSAARALGQASSGAASATNSMASSMNNAANAAANEAAAVRDAAAAERDYWAAKRAATGGNTNLPITGRTDEGVTFFSGGGISDRPGIRRGMVPASAFINAPSFQGGGVIPGGGIPAVLHPNEAVVPLAGGGTIPVQNVSGGQSALLLFKPLMQLLESQRQTKTEVSRVWETTTAQTVVTKGMLDKILDVLNRIDNHRFVEVIRALNDISANIQSGGFGGGGGGFDLGGFSLGGGKLNFGGLSASDQAIVSAQLRAAQSQLASAAIAARNAANMGFSFGAKSGNAPQYQSPAQVEARASATSAYLQALAQYQELLSQFSNLPGGARVGGGGAFGGGGNSGGFFGAGGGGSSGGFFASGSPNAFKDVQTGGFTAVLHPDEAVIPLPDGRSVPVSLSSDILDRVNDFIMEQDDRMNVTMPRPRARDNANSINVSVQMTINAKDVNSFKASQDQMIRELQTKLDKAVRTIGKRPDIDDPTVR